MNQTKIEQKLDPNLYKDLPRLKCHLSDEEIDKLAFNDWDHLREFIFMLDKKQDQELEKFKGERFQKDMVFPKHSCLRIIQPEECYSAGLCLGRLNIHLNHDQVITDICFG